MTEGQETSDERLPPRLDRTVQDETLTVRCAKCDWQLIDGEGIVKTRPCCVAGLQHDLDQGLTPARKPW
jgi:hypothetical protein